MHNFAINNEIGVKMDSNHFLESLNWAPVDDFNNKLSQTEQLFRIRHSTAHIMAFAVQLVIPGIHHFATGPATALGFFYDIKLGEKINQEELERIEEKMREIVNAGYPFERAMISREEAYELFEALDQPIKKEILNKIPDANVTLYRVGNFVDLCAGPHVANSKDCSVFKLLNVSASHWKEEEFPSLTRLTGTAWKEPKQLRKYTELMDEMKKRDHRNLGPQLDLFSFHPWAASALWHPKGVKLRTLLADFWRESIFDKEKYEEILNPILYKKELFETSGHWQHFQEDMFVIKKEEEVNFVLKPMNCPDTMLYFASRKRSYRELPLRVAEGQLLHRNERPGALHGIMRARNFNQDDAHIFLATEHLEEEIKDLLAMINNVYKVFGLNYELALSTRPEKFMGDLELWDQAEAKLKEVLSKSDTDFRIDEGEGAFYGPKIDITIKDSLGRAWQCGTIQLDFQLPIRFDLKYTKSDGELDRPIVIHRAIFGSFERFIGIIIEHFGGAFPTWLSPLQIAVLPISDAHIEYALSVKEQLKKEEFRVWVDTSQESLNYKIRSSEIAKTPYIVIVGEKEIETHTVNVRRYGGARLGSMTLTDLSATLRDAVDHKTLDVKVKDYSFLFKDMPEVDVEGKEY